MNNAWNLVLWWVTLATFICLLAFFVYLWVRLAFSYIALLYTKKTENKTKKYIDESFKISKGKVIQIIGLILPILLITFLFSTIKDNLPDNQILFTIYSIIVFLFVEWISYMGYISIYLILKKDKN